MPSEEPGRTKPRNARIAAESAALPKIPKEAPDKIVAMCARGMRVREIRGFLAAQDGTELSPEFIRSVTDAVMAEVAAWRARPREPMYPVAFFDALRVKILEDAGVRSNAIYLALGVLPDGTRDILGLWIDGTTEGAKFWLKVFNDLKTRGVADVLTAVTDGLEGIGAALAAVFPATTLQTCIVHLIRNSLDFAGWKDRRALAAALEPAYTAPNAGTAAVELDSFEQGAGGTKFPAVVAAWQRACDRVIPLLALPPEVRRVIYATNAIDSIHARLRKIIKTRGHFPSDDAVSRLIWPALRNITADWGRAVEERRAAINQFAIAHGDRFIGAAGQHAPPTCPQRRSFVASDARRRGQVSETSHTEIQTAPATPPSAPCAMLKRAKDRFTCEDERQQGAGDVSSDGDNGCSPCAASGRSILCA